MSTYCNLCSAVISKKSKRCRKCMNIGRKLSAETKNKIRQKQFKCQDEIRQGIRFAPKYVITPEIRKKRSEALKGKTYKEIYGEEKGQLKAKKHSDSMRKKYSLGELKHWAKGKKATGKRLTALKTNWLGKKRSEKTKKKISEKKKGMKLSYLAKIKISETRKRKCKSGEIVAHNKGKTKNNYKPLQKVSKKLIGVKRPYMLGENNPSKRKDVRAKLSKANAGKNNAMYGVKYSELYGEQHRKAMRASKAAKAHIWKLNNNPVYQSKPEKKMIKILEEAGFKPKKKWIKEIAHPLMVDGFIHPNIVLECDGKYWHNYPHGNEIDHIRNKEMKQAGYKVLRFWEDEINEKTVLEAVCKTRLGLC